MAAPTHTDKLMKGLQKKMQLEFTKQPTTVNDWLLGRKKFPQLFQVNEQGDLLVPAIYEGDRHTTIPIEPKVPATKEYTADFFVKQKEMLKEPEQVHTLAKRELRSIMSDYKKGLVPISDVVDANRKVHDAECKINSLTKLPRFIEVLNDINENSITFEHYESRKMAEPTIKALYTPVPWNAFWMSSEVKKAEEADLVSQATTTAQGTTTAKPKRIFTAKQRAIMAANRAKTANRTL